MCSKIIIVKGKISQRLSIYSLIEAFNKAFDIIYYNNVTDFRDIIFSKMNEPSPCNKNFSLFLIYILHEEFSSFCLYNDLRCILHIFLKKYFTPLQSSKHMRVSFRL